MGKLSNKDLETLIGCIKKDFRVVVPPMLGYDAGVHLLHGKYVVVATDPCTGVPEDWFGWLLTSLPMWHYLGLNQNFAQSTS